VGDPYPNPTSGSVTIPFATHLQQEEVRLQLFDLTGTLVCVVASGQFAPGLHTATWDVMGDQRTQLPKGIYLYRFVSSAGVVRTGKIILQ
jgi:flagellar hook assembly protein FlgD